MKYNILAISRKLILALDSHAIEYCLWKNNDALINGLAGEDDLDILLKKSHYSDFLQIIISLGFKEAYNNNIKYPYIFHYYGFDSSGDKFIHLHVHLKVISGESHIKNFHLPLEDMILKNTINHPTGCPVPEPEVEIIVFILRYYIKISCLPGALLIGKRISAVDKEFNHIRKNIRMEKVSSLLNEYFPHITVIFFKQMLDGYLKNKNTLTRALFGIRLRNKISSLRRLNKTRSFLSRYYQILYRLINKIFLHQKKSLASGGAVVAITGLDATGKSTITKALHHWLKTDFNVRCLHVGRPNPRIETLLIRGMLTLRRKLLKPAAKSSQLKPRKQGIIFSIRYLVLAYERFALARHAFRLRANGYIVICDRYPSLNLGKMDSPQISKENQKNLVGLLGRLERSLYARMPLPDMMYRLTIPLEAAIARNRLREKSNKETDAELSVRYKENVNLNYAARNFEEIDTLQELPFVLKQLKQKIWQQL